MTSLNFPKISFSPGSSGERKRNVTDETYYLAAYRSGAFMYLGDARNARLTLDYDF